MPSDRLPAPLLHILGLPDLDRAERIGEFWSYPQSRTFAELLIESEEDRTLLTISGSVAVCKRLFRRLPR